MDKLDLSDLFSEFLKKKKVEKASMVRVLQDVFMTIIRRKYNTDENFEVVINMDNGDLQIWRNRVVVPDVFDEYDENLHIRISDAHKVADDYEVGEEFGETIPIESFGRRLVQTARQTLIQKIRDLEKYKLYEKYKDLVDDLVSCEVYQVLKKEVILIDQERCELILPKTEQIYKDKFRKGDAVRAIVHRVEMNNGNPRIILSRTSPMFLSKLFEAEIPEVYEGLITIKHVVREPGDRAKVAVESYDDRIDPVGACVGMKGSRIHSIVRELQNENIDVINYTENMELYIQRALSPASITSIKIDEESGRASVFLKRDQISLAIGKGGQNIRLASKLVELEIDVFRDDVPEEEEDIDLTEFSDAIEEWVIDALHSIGIDTARALLDMSAEEISRRADLEEETVHFILDVVSREFQDDREPNK